MGVPNRAAVMSQRFSQQIQELVSGYRSGCACDWGGCLSFYRTAKKAGASLDRQKQTAAQAPRLVDPP
jgi:hypothetical protein